MNGCIVCTGSIFNCVNIVNNKTILQNNSVKFSKVLNNNQLSVERYFLMMSMGMGNITVEFFSALIPLRVCDKIRVMQWEASVLLTNPFTSLIQYIVMSWLMYLITESDTTIGHCWTMSSCRYFLLLTCRYLSWRAPELSEMTSLAIFRAWLAFCSPWAAMTLALASLAASASAAITRWSWTGSLTSLLGERLDWGEAPQLTGEDDITSLLAPPWSPRGLWPRPEIPDRAELVAREFLGDLRMT